MISDTAMIFVATSAYFQYVITFIFMSILPLWNVVSKNSDQSFEAIIEIENLDFAEEHKKVEFSQVFRQSGFCRGGRREPTNTFAKLPINLAHLFMRRPRIQDEDILDCG